MVQERCRNDNHGRALVTVRFCPDCGEVVSKNIPTRRCSEEEHARRRRAQENYCVDCGERLVQWR